MLRHDFPFDPTYGYSLDDLLAVAPPDPPADFDRFWQARFDRVRARAVAARRSSPRAELDGWRVRDLAYDSTDGVRIGGWIAEPATGEIRRGFVVGHGYGGRDGPDLRLPFDEAVLLFPCCRGLGRSPHPRISSAPEWHVLHDIQDRDRYVLGGCVEDTWLAVNALLELYPTVAGRVGYLGVSFSGGIGALAAAFDDRLARVHLAIPSFGHQPLRLALPTVGSGAAVQAFDARHPAVARPTLRYHDAAVAARRITVPVHLACARFDPFVAPPGQFAVHNALPGEKRLFVLDAGHFPHPRERSQAVHLLAELDSFFAPLRV